MIIRKILIVFFVFVFIALAVGFYLYNKPHRNISQTKPEYIINSKMLSDLYYNDEASADGKYLGRVLEVQGKVLSHEISSANSGVIVLEGNEFSSIRCDLSETEMSAKNIFQSGTHVTVRGTCIGLLLDVNMRDCIIINEEGK